MLRKILNTLETILAQLGQLEQTMTMCYEELHKFNAPSTKVDWTRKPIELKKNKLTRPNRHPGTHNEGYIFKKAGYPRQNIRAFFFAAAKCGVLPQKDGRHYYIPKDKADDMINCLIWFKKNQGGVA